MALTRSETVSVKVSVEEKGLLRRVCADAAMSEADGYREALTTWARNRDENVRLKALENKLNLLIDAIAVLSERFDACVQINLEADDPTAKVVRAAVEKKAEESELAGVGA